MPLGRWLTEVVIAWFFRTSQVFGKAKHCLPAAVLGRLLVYNHGIDLFDDVAGVEGAFFAECLSPGDLGNIASIDLAYNKKPCNGEVFNSDSHDDRSRQGGKNGVGPA